MAEPPVRLAVLIDADNISPSILERLFAEIAGLGVALVRRAYGDFTKANLASWNEAMRVHAIVPMQHGNNTKGKNASDIGLVIDAMDLLHSGRVDAFCVVSSDGDFTRLATHIREQGRSVYGFGDRKTPDSLVSACHKFIHTDILGDGPGQGSEDAIESKPAKAATVPLPALRKAVDAASDENGWSHLGQVGQIIQNRLPEFDVRSYGHKTLKALFEATNAFDVRSPQGGSGAVLVRPLEPRKAK